MGRVDCHFVFRALYGGAAECGDTGLIKVDTEQCFLGLVDALGHGRDAHIIGCMARDYLDVNFRNDLVVTMQGLHRHLQGTKGVVAALCRIDLNTGDIRYVGIGNIAVKILGPRTFSFAPRDGVIGYIIPTPREQHQKLGPGDILVMYSDGIQEHFDPLDCAGLFAGTAESIAHGLLEQFGKENDDASCIALRYLI
ncbi:MAG: SpoIIE family protein phosphatase [Chloroflexota bacterium]